MFTSQYLCWWEQATKSEHMSLKVQTRHVHMHKSKELLWHKGGKLQQETKSHQIAHKNHVCNLKGQIYKLFF